MAVLTKKNFEAFELNYSDIKSTLIIDNFILHSFKLNNNLGNYFARFIALSMLIVISPVLLLTGFCIKISMGGNVFYKQTRVGLNGKNFNIFKFRTMIENAELKSGPVIASKNDPRITNLGRFLRASHIDEFPQLINIILGDMTFVGPRPERPEFVSIFEKEIDFYIRRREVRPGITGLAQICLSYDATANEKIHYDLFFINHKNSILFSLVICYYTFLKMIHFRKFI